MNKFRRGLLMPGGTDNPILNDYLTIVALEDGLSAKLSINACEYCVDGDGNWKTLPADTETDAVNAGHTLSFRGNLLPDSTNGIGTFAVSKHHNLKGDCMSLLFGDDAKKCFSLADKNYAFRNLFIGNNKLIDASELSLKATTLGKYCYGCMFQGCTSLITAPKLPAINLTHRCYFSMFQNCTSLITSPELPATSLIGSDYCYYCMFQGYTALTTARRLSAEKLSIHCCSYMFKGCISLIIAPELPATELAANCYYYMFQGCTALTNMPYLPATILAQGCYWSMFNGCKSLITVQKLPAENLESQCYNRMFQGCTSLVNAPELPATKLTTKCYDKMFADCSKLNSIEMLATDINADDCLTDWVNGVAEAGIFVKSKDATWDVRGVSGIPEGWEVITE